MKVQIQKWGNSLAIRIPKSFAKEIHIDQGAFLDLSTVGGKLVANPIKTDYSLQELLDKITDANMHHEIDTGNAVGKEIW
jgi:antitoxin MazE